MREELDIPETSATVKSCMEDLQRRHVQDIHTLFDLQAQDYLSRALDDFLTKDDNIDVSEIDVRSTSSFFLIFFLLAGLDDRWDDRLILRPRF